MKLYVLFVGKGTWGIGWPYIGYDEEKLCKSILKRLEKTFPQIEFIGGKIVSKYDLKELWEIKQGIRGSDGLLIYIVGNYGTNPMIDSIGVEAMKIGKPTILASYMYGGDWGFIRMYERIRGKGFPVLPIASSNFNDVEKAIRIMEGLYRMRGKKILIFTFDKAEIVRSEEDNKRLLRELSMFKERLGGERDAILLHLVKAYIAYKTGRMEKDSLATAEITSLTGGKSSTVGARLSELVSLGWVERVGRGEYRMTTLGIRNFIDEILPKIESGEKA